jgi:hypothetical protein
MSALAQLEKCGGWEILERVSGHRWEISGCGSGPTSVRCLWTRKEPSRNARGWKIVKNVYKALLAFGAAFTSLGSTSAGLSAPGVCNRSQLAFRDGNGVSAARLTGFSFEVFLRLLPIAGLSSLV